MKTNRLQERILSRAILGILVAFILLIISLYFLGTLMGKVGSQTPPTEINKTRLDSAQERLYEIMNQDTIDMSKNKNRIGFK